MVPSSILRASDVASLSSFFQSYISLWPQWERFSTFKDSHDYIVLTWIIKYMLPIPRSLITSAEFLLLCKVLHLQFLRIRCVDILAGRGIFFQPHPTTSWPACLTELFCNWVMHSPAQHPHLLEHPRSSYTQMICHHTSLMSLLKCHLIRETFPHSHPLLSHWIPLCCFTFPHSNYVTTWHIYQCLWFIHPLPNCFPDSLFRWRGFVYFVLYSIPGSLNSSWHIRRSW